MLINKFIKNSVLFVLLQVSFVIAGTKTIEIKQSEYKVISDLKVAAEGVKNPKVYAANYDGIFCRVNFLAYKGTHYHSGLLFPYFFLYTSQPKTLLDQIKFNTDFQVKNIFSVCCGDIPNAAAIFNVVFLLYKRLDALENVQDNTSNPQKYLTDLSELLILCGINQHNVARANVYDKKEAIECVQNSLNLLLKGGFKQIINKLNTYFASIGSDIVLSQQHNLTKTNLAKMFEDLRDQSVINWVHTEDILYYDVTKNGKPQTEDNRVVIYSKNDMCHRCISKFGDGSGENKFFKKAFPNEYIVFISLKKYKKEGVDDGKYMTFVANGTDSPTINTGNPKHNQSITYLCLGRISEGTWPTGKDILEITFDDSSHLVTKVEFTNAEQARNNPSVSK